MVMRDLNIKFLEWRGESFEELAKCHQLKTVKLGRFDPKTAAKIIKQNPRLRSLDFTAYRVCLGITIFKVFKNNVKTYHVFKLNPEMLRLI